MLPAAHRLTEPAAFRAATRSGRRCGSPRVVVHLHEVATGGPARVGLVVSKAVGGSVQRNRVKRRLRHLARERLSMLPGSCVLVVRALPAAAGADYATLGADLDRCLARVLP